MASKAGRKPKYQESFVQLAYWMAKAGLTDEEMAREFGVDRRSLTRWKKSHPEFGEALARGKETPDDKVEAAMYRRCIGYTVTETKEKETWRGPEREIIVKDIAPDVVACIFWLKNRRPERWRDVHKVESTSTVTIEIQEAAKRINEIPEAREYARAAFRAAHGGNGHSRPAGVLETGCPN
jgi:hypothetical protein